MWNHSYKILFYIDAWSLSQLNTMDPFIGSFVDY